jgi:hypothetical protein
VNKAELLTWLEEANQKWHALLDRIGPARLEQPGVNGDWSMKDIVAHLTGWNRWLVIRLQAALAGEAQISPPQISPPWPAHLQSEDEINAWIYEAGRGRSLQEILDEMHQVHRQLVAVIESMPDDRQIEVVHYPGREFYLLQVGDERFPVGEFFDHFQDDHEADVGAWLTQVEKATG